MKLNKFFLHTSKEIPLEASSISHILMIRAGMIRQNFAGIYTILPLGQIILDKIQKIIETELDKAECLKVTMPIIQEQKLWEITGRSYGKETLRMKDRHDNELLFSPTAEELITDNMKQYVKSYKELPLNIYQINTKFRDEIRPRFGLMRGREFLMKDGYSFDIDEKNSHQMYRKMYNVYNDIFAKIGVKAIPMLADTGEIGGDLSHEFHILSQTGETEIFYDKDLLNINFNSLSFEEIKQIPAFTDEKIGDRDLSKYQSSRGIEVGQIFYIGQKYTKAMDFKIQDQNGALIYPEMATFGIGLGRLMAAVIEASHDKDGIIWPEAISPFDFILINTNTKDANLNEISDKIYNLIKNKNRTVLYDDTDKSFGEKIKNADLIGISKKIIIGKNWLEKELIEIKDRKTKESNFITFEEFIKNLN